MIWDENWPVNFVHPTRFGSGPHGLNNKNLQTKKNYWKSP